MKSIFKKSKKQPIKFKGYKYIGQHPDYNEVHFYIRNIGNDNYDFMESKLIKNKRKYEVTAGTSIKVIDSFMYNCIKADLEGLTFKDREEFVAYTYDNSFKDRCYTSKEDFIKIYTTKIPNEIKTKDIFKQATKEGFEVLYCGKSLQEKQFETYSIVLVKKEKYDFYGVQREYTKFKSILYMTNPSYVKKEGVVRFNEFPQSDLNILHDILNK